MESIEGWDTFHSLLCAHGFWRQGKWKSNRVKCCQKKSEEIISMPGYKTKRRVHAIIPRRTEAPICSTKVK